MSAQTKTERVLRDVLNSDNLRDLLSGDVVHNAMKWRFLQAALYVLDGHGLLGDPDAVKVATPAPPLPTQDGDDDGREAAPLDPKSVHVGDTVTVRFIETGDVLTTKAYQPDDVTAPGEYVYLLGWPLHRANGKFGLAISHFEILAIEPAPKPVWMPGDIGMATVSGKANVRVMRVLPDDRDPVARPWVSDHPIGGWLAHTDSEVSDFVPDEPRPLPTRDELARVMHDDYLPNSEPRLGRTHREILADAVLAHLRGESR